MYSLVWENDPEPWNYFPMQDFMESSLNFTAKIEHPQPIAPILTVITQKYIRSIFSYSFIADIVCYLDYLL